MIQKINIKFKDKKIDSILTDVQIQDLYHLEGNHPIEEFNTLDNPKWKRWAERLGFISF